ncbi:MAG TPA: GNAT family N-acetyltransferase [Bryobacteraceae bacterium]|nr:GNAT family N-acetyltransferase [Bryobacteraceae bacterium]
MPQELERVLEAKTLPKPFCYYSRLYVMKRWRGTGIVSRLVKASFAEFHRIQAEVAICHCYPHLQGFYERVGFRPYGKPFIQTGLDELGWQRPLRCAIQRSELVQSA